MGETGKHRGVSAEAYRVFGDYVARLDAGEAADFEALLQEHRDLASDLRFLAAQGRPDSSRISLEPARDDGEGDYLERALHRLESRTNPFDRYRMEEEVGHGGMAIVRRVWDEDLRRSLAMKVIREQHAGVHDPEHPERISRLGRFLEEAQVNGQLHHPGILPVHELGIDGQHKLYFTMPLVKGRDLKEIFKRVHAGDEEWTTTRALGALLRVCEAVAYAHDKNVIHRDLKPANIMVGKYGEVYVMDWGLARVLGEPEKKNLKIRAREDATLTVINTDRIDAQESATGSPLVTMDGDVIGTPSYMSPEQARGEIEKMGPTSDVYSLGAILYHLLAGQSPYIPKGARVNPHMVLLRIQEGPPRRLQRLAPEAPAELIAICERAMARKIANRYASVSELPLLAHQRVATRPRDEALIQEGVGILLL